MITRTNIQSIGAPARYGSTSAPEMLHAKTLNGQPAAFERFNDPCTTIDIPAAPLRIPSLRRFYAVPYSEALDWANRIVAEAVAAGSGTGERTAARQGKVTDTLFERAKWRREEVRISHPGAPRASNDNRKKEDAA